MKVSIWSDPAFGGVYFLLHDFRNGKRYVVQPVEMKIKEVDENEPAEPTFRMSSFEAEEFLCEIAKICEERKIRPEGKLPLENELSAIKYHLEDMRSLVFGLKKKQAGEKK